MKLCKFAFYLITYRPSNPRNILQLDDVMYTGTIRRTKGSVTSKVDNLI